MLPYPSPTFGFPPWRLSGVVLGTLLNDPAVLSALGDAVYAPPYKAPPREPVLYLKPRNTWSPPGATVPMPADVPAFEIGASLGIVIGRTACRVDAAQALDHVAGYTLVADLCVPHDSLYRPSVRQRARDGSCLVGPAVVPRTTLPDADALTLTVSVDGQHVHAAPTAGMRRPVARLIQDVSAFMTLRPGDLLMLGVRANAPLARTGQRFAVECAGIGRLEGRLDAQELPA